MVICDDSGTICDWSNWSRTVLYFSIDDKIEFGFWVWRYVMTAALFVIGLIGPGLPTNAYTALKDEDEEKVFS